MRYYRCPPRELQACGLELMRFVESYHRFREKSLLPVAGGWSDQAATWTAAVRHAQVEAGDYARDELEHRREREALRGLRG